MESPYAPYYDSVLFLCGMLCAIVAGTTKKPTDSGDLVSQCTEVRVSSAGYYGNEASVGIEAYTEFEMTLSPPSGLRAED